MCWSTNKSNSTWSNQEDGCIRVAGTTNDPVGQYKLNITVSALLGSPPLTIPINNINADAAGLRYDVKIYAPGTNCVIPQTIDTTIAGLTAGSGCPVGVNDPTAQVSQLQISPSPVSSVSNVTFVAEQAGVYTESITDLVGRVVFENKLEVVEGANTSVITKGSLPTGMYFYNLQLNGKKISKKFNIAE